MQKVRIFGDSILKRVVYNESEDRYSMLPQKDVENLGARLALQIYNSTMFGCTVGKGMQLLKRALQKDITYDYVLLEFGGNDCDFLWEEVSLRPLEEHQPNTPLPLFKETLTSMISLLKERNIEVLLATLPPIDSERYLAHICRKGLNKDNILIFLQEVTSIERFQELYSKMVEEIAKETHTRVIDIRQGFLSQSNYRSLIGKDGIHPNEKGHELILSLVADYREKHSHHYKQPPSFA